MRRIAEPVPSKPDTAEQPTETSDAGPADAPGPTANAAARHAADARAEADRATRSSDAHDPNAKGAWLGLLSFLSDEELARYGRIAADQRAQEAEGAVWQIASLAAGLACVAAAAFEYVNGYGWVLVLATLAAAWAFMNWPYRKLKARQLWNGHVEAVAREQGRRAAEAQSERR